MLRNNITKEEKILWLRISRKQIKGYRFRRQYSIGGYIVDFYCPKLKYAIETDGENHSRKKVRDYDESRQSTIESINVKFFRVKNKQINENIDSVIKDLIHDIEKIEKENLINSK